MFDKLVDLIVSSIRLFQFWAIMPPYAGGVVLRLGNFHRMARPGFNWMIPAYVETILETNVVPDTLVVGPQSLVTKDGIPVVVSIVITYEIENIKTFLLEVEGGVQVLEDSACGIVANRIMGYTWSGLIATNLANELSKSVRAEAKKYGVRIVRVQLKDFTKCRSLRLISPTTHAHMGHSI